MKITIGKRPRLFWLFWTTLFLTLVLWLVSSTSAQEPGPLEAVCLTIASDQPANVPVGITAGEFCKVMVALLASEWDARSKIQTTILLVNNHEGRLTVHHQRLAAIETDITQLQSADSVAGLQQQIDFINTKLAAVAAALQ